MNLTHAVLQLGTAIFAITGVLAAARQDMDALSFIVIGVVTAIGGGTLRDMVLGVPVFWIDDVSFLWVSTLAALLAFFFERRFRSTERALLYFDGVATALFAVMATEKTLKLGHAPGVALAMGVVTGIGGGLIRDVITGHPTILLRRELYITPILIGGAFYLAARVWTSIDPENAAVVAIIVIAMVRSGAIRWGWEFPDWLSYRTKS